LRDCDERQRHLPALRLTFAVQPLPQKGAARPDFDYVSKLFARVPLNTTARVANCLASGTGTGQMHISERAYRSDHDPNRRTRRESNPKGTHLHCGRTLSAGRCDIYDGRQADCQLDRQASAAEEITRLDQILTALSISRLVLRTRDRARANQAHRSLPDSNGPIYERSCDFHFRRTAEARVGRETVQPYTGKVDENSSLCVAIWMVSPGHGLAKGNGSLAHIRIACQKRREYFETTGARLARWLHQYRQRQR